MIKNLNNLNILWCVWNAPDSWAHGHVHNDIRKDVKFSSNNDMYQALFEFGIHKQSMELNQFKEVEEQKPGTWDYGPVANSFQYDIIFCTKHFESLALLFEQNKGEEYLEDIFNPEKGLNPSTVYYQSEDIFYCDSNTFTTMSLMYKFKDFATQVPLDQMFIGYMINVGLQHVELANNSTKDLQIHHSIKYV